jgi:penicillin amidase
MTAIQPEDEAAREAVGLLRAWDFRMDADRVEPLLFTAWLRAFAHAVLFGRFGEAAAGFWDLKPLVMEAVLTRHAEWCAGPQHPNETCETRLAAALDDALAQLRERYGPQMAQWQWGRAHIARFPNQVLGRIPVIRDWVQVAVPTPGSYDTLNRGPSTIRDDADPYEQRFGAGLRMVTDLAAPAEAHMMIVPGQSGNPLSPHFADLLLRWRQFDWLVPGRAGAVATLVLEPAQ